MPKGVYKRTEEHKRHICEANKGKHRSKKTRKRISKAMKGIMKSSETKRKISEAHIKNGHKPPSRKGIPWSEERKKKIIENYYSYWQGKHHTEEARRKISKAHKGKCLSKEHRQKISEAKKGRCRGDKNSNWQGGISFEPYNVDWIETLKRSIRERDHYICQLCGILQGDRAFDIHHIDYDKFNCNPYNLITLCKKCHGKTNFNREYWIKLFMDI